MSGVAVRRALAGKDETGLTALLEDAKGSFGPLRGGEAFVRSLEPLADTLGSAVAEGRVWVSQEDAEAFSGLAFGWIDENQGWFGVWVRPDWRQRGIGRQLAREVLHWLSSENVDSIDAFALPGDRPTKQLLESLGFKARLLVMRKAEGN